MFETNRNAPEQIVSKLSIYMIGGFIFPVVSILILLIVGTSESLFVDYPLINKNYDQYTQYDQQLKSLFNVNSNFGVFIALLGGLGLTCILLNIIQNVIYKYPNYTSLLASFFIELLLAFTVILLVRSLSEATLLTIPVDQYASKYIHNIEILKNFVAKIFWIGLICVLYLGITSLVITAIVLYRHKLFQK